MGWLAVGVFLLCMASTAAAMPAPTGAPASASTIAQPPRQAPTRANARQAATRSPNTQVTPLATVRAVGTTHRDANDTGIDGWGATPRADTPASVTLVNRQELSDHHVRTLNDLTHEDASLGDAYAPIGYVQNITIRGFPLDFATGYRINGLLVTGQQNIAFEDVDHVDVLKGLTGIRSGIDEPGGSVNFVTKRPANVQNVTLGTDSHGTRYAAVDVGHWLTPDFGVRANLAWEDLHSYVHHADGRRNFYALAADWDINSHATLELDGQYQTSAQRSVSGYQLLGGNVVPPHPHRKRMLGHEPWDRPSRPQSVNLSARLNDRLTGSWHLRVAVGHSRSVIQDNVSFAYGCAHSPACVQGPSRGVFFATNGDYDVWDFRSPGETYVDDQGRITLSGAVSTGPVRHDFTFGTSAFHHKVALPNEVFAYVGTANIADPEPPFFPPSPEQPSAPHRRLDTWQRSIFVLDHLALGGHWQAFAGARLVRLDGNAWNGSAVLERHTRVNRVLPQAAVLWRPLPSVTAYASYSKGLALGKQAPYWTSNSGDTLGPRLTRQVQVGLKYRPAARIRLGLALYRIHEPDQFARPDGSSAGFTFVQRGSEVHKGVELTATGALTRHLGLEASASWIHARAQGIGVAADEDHQAANVPKLRINVHATYQVPGLPSLTILGGWLYSSSKVAVADGAARVPGYDVFDLGARYITHWGGHRATWRLAVDNVFNRLYWQFSGSDTNDNYLILGAPRIAHLTLTVGL